MNWKPTLQGGLIYFGLVAFLLAALCFLFRRDKSGKTFFALAFLVASMSWIYRGLHTGHVPLQNLFEIFLAMAALLWPLTRIGRRLFGVEIPLGDALLGVILLFPAGFVFSEELRRLPPALQSPLFIPHVGSYLLGYLFLARSALLALPLFRPAAPDLEAVRIRERASFQMASLGFALITLGLVFGAIWGKLAWGDYWHWDPKEMWSLATWLVYAGYFHGRAPALAAGRFRLLALWLWLGLLFVVLTLTWINLSRLFPGLHNYA